MSDKHRDYWSDCEQIYFLDGYGLGGLPIITSEYASAKRRIY
jgi:hypothetical protein